MVVSTVAQVTLSATIGAVDSNISVNGTSLGNVAGCVFR